MELLLKRRYYQEGCNGVIFHRNVAVCCTIELPWRNNKKGISCIPEGRYLLYRRLHPQKGLQLCVAHVPHREVILIHPANYALRELQGCIAPVKSHTGEGKGSYSVSALAKLQDLIYPAMDNKEKVWLVIVEESIR